MSTFRELFADMPPEDRARLEKKAEEVLARTPSFKTPEEAVQAGVDFIMGTTAPAPMLDFDERLKRIIELEGILDMVVENLESMALPEKGITAEPATKLLNRVKALYKKRG